MSIVLVPKAQQQSDYVLFIVEHPSSQAAFAKGYMDVKWTTFKFLSQSALLIFCYRLGGCRALKWGFLFTNNFSSEHSSNANSMSHPQLVSTCWKCLLKSQLVCVKVFFNPDCNLTENLLLIANGTIFFVNQQWWFIERSVKWQWRFDKMKWFSMKNFVH